MTSASPSFEPGVQKSTDGELPTAAADQETRLALHGLPQQQPPLANSCWLHGRPPGPGQVSVIVGQQALKQILAHGRSDLHSEVGGALLGTAYRHEARVYVTVEAALPAVSHDHGPIHFKFTADSWAQLHQDKASTYPQLEIVGWFHTHPDLGVFYSADDVVVHSAAFTLPWHVGLVFDPVRNEASLFGWVDGVLAAYDGFYERHEDQAESAIPWQVVSSSVWDESYPPQVATSSTSRVVSPRPILPTVAAPLGVIAGALGLLLGFFLLVGWVIPLNRQIDRLETVITTLADEALAEEHLAACPDPDLRILTPLTGSLIQAGRQLPILGTAAYPGAARYRVEVRPAGGDEWTLLNSRARVTSLGELAEWDTSEHNPMPYEMRLTAVDRNNVILAGSTSCSIQLELVP
jgi:proteasome lid subunit RPN8/RPN11